MITSRLVGGLGNQMFQYAAGRALAARLSAPLLLDAAEFGNYRLHAFGLHHFAIAAEVVYAKRQVSDWEKNIFRAMSFLGIGRAENLYRERDFRFDQAVLSLPDHSRLEGYWQSEKYFADKADLIRAELTVKTPADDENLRVLQSIHSGVSVSLHIRRGDYVSDSRASATHGTCDLAYYEAAVKYVAARCGQAPSFFVFSDDPDWAEANLQLPFKTVLIRHNGPEKNYEDLRLMSACNHHIIANSTFSWWGAWLNPEKNKIVVAPQRWFVNSAHDSTDLLPAEWVRL